MDSPNGCVLCSLEYPWPQIVLGGFVCAFLVLGATYASMMLLRPYYLKHLFSTIGIFIAHLQTLRIVFNLSLAWPRSTEATFELMAVDGLNLEAVRPECLFQGNESELPFFYIMSIFRILLPLVLLLLLGGSRWTLMFCFRRRLKRASIGEYSRRTTQLEARLDKLELLETIVFSLVLVTSWIPILDLLDARGAGTAADGSAAWAMAGSILASFMLAVQIAFATRYFLNYRAMVAVEEAGKRLSWLSTSRLQYRLSYQTKRFAVHAPQCVARPECRPLRSCAARACAPLIAHSRSELTIPRLRLTVGSM